MKQLTCEMCGSTDLMKQEGVFVCQTCGCKYSVEEAKKMMIEGTVDVSGSKVKVDDSEELKNLYQIARRAKDSNNSENAAKYYDMILMKDPQSWEANFYTVYYKSASCKIGEIKSAIANVENCIEDTLMFIKKNVHDNKERTLAVEEVVLRTNILAELMWQSYERHFNGISSSIRANYMMENIGIKIATTTATIKPIICIINLFADDEYFMLNYGYETIRKFMVGRDEWQHADAAKRVLAKYDKIIAQHRREEEERKAKEAKARFDEYWVAHAEEKETLQAEQDGLESEINNLNTKLNDQVAALNKEIAAIPGGTEIANLDERINKLTSDRNALGFFKGKEKKALQEQIDQLVREKTAIQSRMAAAKKELEAKIAAAKADVQKKVAPMQSRVTAINNELTKAR